MRFRCHFVTLVALVAIFAVASPAWAQTTGDVEGTVMEPNGSPLPGVSVEAKSAALIGTRSAVTDAAGRFRFPALPPGSYSLRASLSGFATSEKTVPVQLGKTATITLQMAVTVSSELVVTSEAPTIDVTKATIGTNASIDAIQRLPLGRNFVSIAKTVSGTGTDSTGGLTVYGATSLENSYIIDGVNTTGLKIGDQGKSLNNEFVQEVEVKTGGYEAEYGRVLGGTINVITKSGGNEFHGDVFGYYDSDSLAADDKRAADRVLAKRDQYFTPKRFDAGADLGGYFVKDRLWFFGAYDRVSTDQDFIRTSSQGVTTADGDDQFRSGVDERRTSLYSGKLTFRLGEPHTLAFSVFGDPGKFDGRLQTFRGLKPTDIGPDSAILGSGKSGGTDMTLKYDGVFGANLLVQAQVARHNEKFVESSPFANSPFLEKQQPGFRNEAMTGSGPNNLFDQEYTRNAYRVAGTGFLGAHEVKAGLDWEHLDSTFSEFYPGTGRIRARLTAAGALRNYQHRYYAQTPIQNHCLQKADPTQPYSIGNCLGYAVAATVDNPPTTDNIALFAQDQWKVLPNLTVNAGVRYEQQKLDDYTGATLINLKDEWSPRVGVIWDPTAKGKAKVYANFGRYYQSIPQDIQTRALGNEYTIFVRNRTGNVVNPIDDNGFGYGVVQGGELTQTGLKGMYQDEIVGGVEWEFAKNWSVGVKGLYRALGRVVEDRCDLAVNPDLAAYFPAGSTTTCALINVGEGNSLGTIKDLNDRTCYPNGGVDPNTGGIAASQPCEGTKASRTFRGVELTLNHRFSDKFYVLGSYLYSKLQGNYSGSLSQTRENGQADPNINADFDYPGLVANAYGYLPNDRRHQVKVSGYYAFDFGLVTGISAYYTSGRPFNVFGCSLDAVACGAGYDREGFLVPRGSGGRLPATYEADLHLEYGLRLGSVTITPVVDVFNLLNQQKVVYQDELFNSDGTLASNNPTNNVGVLPGCTAATARGFQAGCATNPTYGRDAEFQNPRVIRLGARVSF